MELEELKKSWNAFDKQISRASLTGEKQVERLIAAYKAKAGKNLDRIKKIQYVSIITGVALLVVLVGIWLCLPSSMPLRHMSGKLAILLGFIAISVLVGLWWDWKTYRWNKATRIDEMSVAEVSRRMVTFSRWTRNEVIAISVWVLIFNALDYWVMGYYLAPAASQAVIVGVFLVVDAAIIYLFYKKLMFKNIRQIRKDMQDLKDLCTE